MPITNKIAPKHMGLSTRDSCIVELIECVSRAAKSKTSSPTTAEATAFLARLRNLANAQGVSAPLPSLPEAAAFVARLKTLGNIDAEPAFPAPIRARILRLKQVIERTGLSRATLYTLMATDPAFPRKIHLTTRTVGFLETEVDAFIEARAAARNVSKEAA